ncbi:MAG: phosphonate ABC transporter, permease protein PhnE [Armatimonadetes bacterium]|nr:phosphonate ABC transporter, permease protein PhnE [Armatimonadota bacterium]
MRRPSKAAWWAVAGLTTSALVGAKWLGFDQTTLNSLLVDGVPALAKYCHPAWQEMPRLLRLLGETVGMGVVGTSIAMALAIPSPYFAAASIAPNRGVFAVSRQVLNFFRSMPDALIALILVQGMGLGPVPGAIALGLHSFGYVGKNLSEKVERIERGVLDGLRSCGADGFQSFRFGVLPTVEREILSDALYILDRNIRTAATLGLVGAGGIGVELLSALRTFHEDQASTIIVLVVVLVIVIDMASTHARKRLA